LYTDTEVLHKSLLTVNTAFYQRVIVCNFSKDRFAGTR
jgi:hypothetical protein